VKIAEATVRKEAKLARNSLSSLVQVAMHMRAFGVTAGFTGGGESLGHDLANGSRATAALGAAAKASVNLAGGAWPPVGQSAGAADIVIGQDVTGTNDHGGDIELARLCTSKDCNRETLRRYR
jgi:hypothetical protein